MDYGEHEESLLCACVCSAVRHEMIASVREGSELLLLEASRITERTFLLISTHWIEFEIQAC